MNGYIIIYMLNWVILLEGIFLALPVGVAIGYGEKSGWAFVPVMIVCIITGLIGKRKKPQNTEFFAKEGFVVVALSWILMSAIGALPFFISGEIPSYVDSLFETISGFTTTGTSILNDVEALSHCMLFWRSFTHWIGGMGVLVFLIAVMPMVGGNNMYIMKAESPGPSVGKLVPRVRDTAIILYKIYLAITIIQMVILIASGMPGFDAVTLSLGTAGTGGFGIKNDSVASYTMFQQGTISIFMILFGINFNMYYLFLKKKFKRGLQMEEVRWYLIVIAAAVAFIGINARGHFSSLFESFHHALFQVASIITTTGFSTTDFDMWSSAAKTVLVLLMFIGACAGSTGGGIKVSRLVVMFKTIGKELSFYIHPHSVKKIRMDGRSVEHEVTRSINVFMFAYLIIFTTSLFIVSFENKDLVTNFTSVAATFNNIGPGLAGAGPTESFANFSVLSKFVFMFDMLAGRLEIFPMILLFTPSTWRKY